MSELLSELLSAGLIEKLDGDDGRFQKIENAAKAVAKELSAHPQLLIRAILAALDPDTPVNDPEIGRAKRALIAEWRSFTSVYPSEPISLFRSILLEACNQVSEGKNAAILWLTAADTLPLVRLGREESVMKDFLTFLAERYESGTLEEDGEPSIEEPGEIHFEQLTPAKQIPQRKVSREEFKNKIAAASGPNYRNQPTKNSTNPYWPNSNQANSWSWEFADRMNELLADELDSLASDLSKSQNLAIQQTNDHSKRVQEAISSILVLQNRWVREFASAKEAYANSERTRLEILWWAEALYSKSMRCGYRSLPSHLAAVATAFDLVAEVNFPSPASVSYLLAEVVAKLPGAGFDQEFSLTSLLTMLRQDRAKVPSGWLMPQYSPPGEGKLSVRDCVWLAIAGNELETDNTLKRAGLSKDLKLNLPSLAQTIFRQEQAVRLAGGRE